MDIYETRVGSVEVVYSPLNGSQVWKVRLYRTRSRWDFWAYPQWGKAYFCLADPTTRDYSDLPAPSETLRGLIEQFHETEAVAPLVDCLCEEYPDVAPIVLAAYHTQ
jgi:hypothetical protein